MLLPFFVNVSAVSATSTAAVVNSFRQIVLLSFSPFPLPSVLFLSLSLSLSSSGHSSFLVAAADVASAQRAQHMRHRALRTLVLQTTTGDKRSHSDTDNSKEIAIALNSITL